MDSDSLTKSGATRLALRIADYWHSRGFPHFEAAVVPTFRRGNDLLFGVRSNLIDGVPPRNPAPPYIEELVA